MAGKFTKKSLAEAIVKAIPDAPARTLATRLRNDHPEVFDSIEQARSCVRTVLGVNGAEKRRLATLPREKRNAGVAPSCPPTLAEPWLLFKVEGPATVLVLSDIHIPYHNVTVLNKVIAFVKAKFSVTHVFSNGDFGDWYGISRFLKNPKKRNLYDEIKLQKQGIEWLASEFPYADRIFKKGNHDDRWDHWVWNHAPEFSDCEHMQLDEVLKLSKYGWQIVGDNIVMLGELPCFHGHEFGKGGIAAPVNAARGSFTRTLYTNLSAHRHQTSSHTEPDLFKRPITTWTQGCLCDLWPEYARVNKWNWGFVVVEVASDGLFNLHNFQVSRDYEIWRA